MERVCIYPKEAASVLNIGERQAQRIFRKIRKELKKAKQHYITVKEFADYTDIPEETIHLKLKAE